MSVSSIKTSPSGTFKKIIRLNDRKSKRIPTIMEWKMVYTIERREVCSQLYNGKDGSRC